MWNGTRCSLERTTSPTVMEQCRRESTTITTYCAHLFLLLPFSLQQSLFISFSEHSMRLAEGFVVSLLLNTKTIFDKKTTDLFFKLIMGLKSNAKI